MYADWDTACSNVAVKIRYYTVCCAFCCPTQPNPFTVSHLTLLTLGYLSNQKKT